MKKNKTEEIEFIIDVNNKVDFRQVLQMINMYEEKIQKKQAIIDKAINYIEKESAFLSDDEYELFNKKELLQILEKGDSNE